MRLKFPVQRTGAPHLFSNGIAPGTARERSRFISSNRTFHDSIRAKYPHASHRDQIDAAIHLERLQEGGWQDTIASGHTGIFLIRLFQNNWEVQHFDKKCLTQLKKYRKLYEIPNGDSRKPTSILKEMQHREVGMKRMQALVQQGTMALKRLDFVDFGRSVRAGWDIKKEWHPDIETPVIQKMILHAWKIAGAYGWKVCGAGAQGYLLVLGNEKCHEIMETMYRPFEVDNI